MIGVIDVSLNFILEDSPNALLCLRGFGVELGVAIIILIHYFPKVYQVYHIENSMDTMTFDLSKSTTTATQYKYILLLHSMSVSNASMSEMVKKKSMGGSTTRKISLNQRNTGYEEKFKQNADNSDISKISRANLAAILALEEEDS